jgi:hypothetical protein
MDTRKNLSDRGMVDDDQALRAGRFAGFDQRRHRRGTGGGRRLAGATLGADLPAGLL